MYFADDSDCSTDDEEDNLTQNLSSSWLLKARVNVHCVTALLMCIKYGRWTETPIHQIFKEKLDNWDDLCL